MSSDLDWLDEAKNHEGINELGQFMPGVSGNPKGRPPGRPKGSKNLKKENSGEIKDQSLDFEAVDGSSVEDSVQKNSTAFMNKCWRAISNGNKKLTEIAFTNFLKNPGEHNPFAGLDDLEGVSVNEIDAALKELNNE